MAVVGLSDLDPHGRSLVAGVWAFRARAEREAMERFGRIARELRAHDASAVVVEMAERAIDDERRHIAICAETASRYGRPDEATEPSSAGPIGPSALGTRERILYEMVAFCCVTESINAALMTVSYGCATAAPVKSAVREILRDEVTHSRMGWAHLAAERRHAELGWLGAALPAMLAGTVREEFFDPLDADGTVDPGIAGHGELPRSLRLQVFMKTLDDVVFPGLEAHGVPTERGRRWLDRRGRSDGRSIRIAA